MSRILERLQQTNEQFEQHKRNIEQASMTAVQQHSELMKQELQSLRSETAGDINEVKNQAIQSIIATSQSQGKSWMWSALTLLALNLIVIAGLTFLIYQNSKLTVSIDKTTRENYRLQKQINYISHELFLKTFKMDIWEHSEKQKQEKQ